MQGFKFLFLLIAMLYSKSVYSQDFYNVDVDSYGEYEMNGKTFIIMPSSDKIDRNDLEFKEYASFIKKVLATAGARETSNLSDADMCILMHYEITDKSYQETVATPIFGQTGISSITTNTNTNSTINADAKAKVSTYGNNVYGVANGKTNINENQTTTTNITYSYGVTGYNNIQRNVENYLRVINLYAYENVATENPVMIWKTNIMSDGYVNNIRDLFPPMTYSALNNIGISTKKQYEIKTKNPSYQFFKDFKINGDNIFVAPSIDYFSADEKLKIVAIERKPNETIVTFYKSRELPTVSISSKMCLEFNENKIYPLSSKNLKFNKVVKDKKTLFFSIHYPAIPKDVTLINLSEEEDVKSEHKYWKGIHLDK